MKIKQDQGLENLLQLPGFELIAGTCAFQFSIKLWTHP